MKKFKIVVIAIMAMVSLNIFAECYHHYESYQKKLREAKNTSKSVAIATGIASFCGPIATLIVSGAGAGTLAALQAEADRELRKYNECLARVETDKRRVRDENNRRYLEAEAERKRREEALKKKQEEELEKTEATLDEEG